MTMEKTRRDTLFQELVDQYGDALRRLCHGYERNEAMRHELEQEVLLNLWRALPNYRGDASLRTWMYRVAHNTAITHSSKESHQPSKTFDESALHQEASPVPGPATQVEQADARQQLQTLIGTLRPLDRELILLYLEDVPQAEIGEITGLSRANVSTRIHRIKEELTRRLRP